MKRTKKDSVQARKGMWKRTFTLYGKFKIPWHLYIISAILGVVSTEVNLKYIPYMTMLQTGNMDGTDTLWKYLGLALLACIVDILKAIPEFYASSEVTRNLQNKMISRSLRMPMRSYETKASKIVSWITEDCTYADGVITTLIGFFTGIVATYLSIREMSSIDRSMLFLVPAIFIYVIFSTWASGQLMFLRERLGRRAMSELTAYMAEHLGFFREIRQMHTIHDELDIGKRAVNRKFYAEVKQYTLTLVNLLVSGSTSQILTILVFVLGAAKVRSGEFTIEELAAFQAYILVAYESLSSIPDLYTSLMFQNGILYFISGLMAEKDEVIKRKEGMDFPDGDIVFENVTFAYDETPVLKDASFTIPAGKVTMIVGPNGSGKTTLFKILERFYEPDNGRILFAGKDIEDIHLDEWRKSFGYMLQEPMLFAGTVRENIVYGMERDVAEEEIRAAARQASADGFINDLPGGYEFYVGENGSNLSAGQRQKVAIARAMLLDPSYLLLDEATCNVDVRSENAINDTIFHRLQGKTVVMISHDMHMLHNADNIIVLNNGKVEADAPLDEAVNQSPTLRTLINASSQL